MGRLISFVYSCLRSLHIGNAFFVDALFLSSATMFDVRNEFLYFGAEAEGIVNETYPAAIKVKDRELFKEAKSKSIATLLDEVSLRIKGTK